MKEYIPILKKMKLFAGVDADGIATMLECLNARLCDYKKGELVFRQGDIIACFAVPVEGRLHIQSDDYWGNRSIISVVEVGELFGEAYAASGSKPFPNSVAAVEDSRVILFEAAGIMGECAESCKFHSVVVQNLFYIISEKNRRLMQKLGYMSKRTTREKLIAYLSEEAKRSGSGTFSIPFDRQQLADFLSAERSALSRELCRMRDEGLILFRKNTFTLLESGSAQDFTD